VTDNDLGHALQLEDDGRSIRGGPILAMNDA
jgi:hypothetical protein